MAKIILKGGNLVWEGKPGRGGHIMYVLQWLEGLRRLGHEVLYYDKGDGKEQAIHLFASIMKQWWHASLCALVHPSGKSLYGLEISEIQKFGQQAVAIISLGCTFEPDPEPWLKNVHPRILIEQDPGFSHTWACKASPGEIFGVHDIYFTVGPLLGTADCSLPTFGINWLPLWNPVIIDWWNPAHPITRKYFTTVAGWWGNEYNEFEGKMWGPKAEQIKHFISLPALIGNKVGIALESTPNDPEITVLQNHGWLIEQPQMVIADSVAYSNYISSSEGEFSCAKGLYVGTKCGWFSDRSSCYLAAGRPVVVQDTGFQKLLPTGNGLFAVNSVEEAAEAIRSIKKDYTHHAKSAREIALEHFDSTRILSKMLEIVGIR
jgi:hypothetical protein